MEWFYARVSTVAQNEARQIDAAHEAGISDDRIVLDKQSGKDFNRENWQKLVKRLQDGDVLFIKSLDRLGRNYAEILDVWKELTRDRGVDVVVLDMPILDTRRDKTLIGTLVADLVLTVLSFCAENERVYIKERQREGIASAKVRGVKFGRPRRELPQNFEYVVSEWLANRMSQVAAAKACGLPISSFRSVCKRRALVQPGAKPRAARPASLPLTRKDRLAKLRELFDSGFFTTSEVKSALGFRTLIAAYDFLEAAAKNGELKKVASGQELKNYVTGAENVYSFDRTKTVDDVLERFDPIPPEERTLEVQVVGPERERYEQIRTAIQNRIIESQTQQEK